MIVTVTHIYGTCEWYVMRKEIEGGEELYLHKDGTWHPSTDDGNNNFPGLFPSEQSARNCLARHDAKKNKESTEETVEIPVSEHTMVILKSLAEREGKTVEDIAQTAVDQFIEKLRHTPGSRE